MTQNQIITVTARKNMVRARAGEIQLPKIVGFVFGDGGVDESGNIIPLSETDSALGNELLRKKYDGYTMVSDTECKYECTLTEDELAGKEISEIGLYDANGDIVNIKRFSAKGNRKKQQNILYNLMCNYISYNIYSEQNCGYCQSDKIQTASFSAKVRHFKIYREHTKQKSTQIK